MTLCIHDLYTWFGPSQIWDLELVYGNQRVKRYMEIIFPWALLPLPRISFGRFQFLPYTGYQTFTDKGYKNALAKSILKTIHYFKDTANTANQSCHKYIEKCFKDFKVFSLKLQGEQINNKLRVVSCYLNISFFVNPENIVVCMQFILFEVLFNKDHF